MVKRNRMSSAITFNKVLRVLSVVWICAQTVRTSLNASGLHVRKQAIRTTFTVHPTPSYNIVFKSNR
jgi:hypothetical protein